MRKILTLLLISFSFSANAQLWKVADDIFRQSSGRGLSEKSYKAADSIAVNITLPNTTTTAASALSKATATETTIASTSLASPTAIYPAYIPDNSNKLITQGPNNNTIYVFSGKGQDYRFYTLTNNSTLTTQSMAATGTDATQWRVTKIQHCVEVLVAVTSPSATTGTWSSFEVSQAVPPYNTGSSLFGKTCSGAGNSIEYNIIVRGDRKFNVVLGTSGLSTTSATISIDGVAQYTTNLNAGSSGRSAYEFQADAGTHTVRITNNASGNLNVLGLNLYRLQDYPVGRYIETVAYYRNTLIFSDYVNGEGANDFAIWDADAATWGGSYHGGESNIITSLKVDGATVAIPMSTKIIGADISFVQSSTLSWASKGGATLGVRTLTRFGSGDSYQFRLNTVGTVRAQYFYTTLFCNTTAFSILDSPRYYDFSTLPSDFTQNVGRYNQFVFRNPTSAQTTTINRTQYTPDYSSYGGSRVWHMVANGYNKLYAGYVELSSGGQSVTNVNASNVYTFN